MTRLTTFVLRHRRLVAIFWLTLFIAGMAGASKVSDRLGFDFSRRWTWRTDPRDC